MPYNMDVNNDGKVNGEDLRLFQEWFELGDLRADFNGDGFVDGDDFDAFMNQFVLQAGWSVFPLAAGAKQFFCNTDAEVKTALASIVNGRGDQIFLTAGKEYKAIGLLPASGTEQNPLLISRCGDGPNPIVRCVGSEVPLECSGGGGRPSAYHVAVFGVSFEGKNGPGVTFLREGSLNLEGVHINGFADNLNIQGASKDRPARLRLHRTIIANSCSKPDSSGRVAHSQGIYAENVEMVGPGSECVLYHNGWETDADRTIFNHNTYFGANARNVGFVDSISAKASASGLSSNYEAHFDNNLVVDCPVPIWARPSATITNNVVLGSADVDPSNPKGFGIWLLSAHTDAATGKPDGPNNPTLITRNIIAHKQSGVGSQPAIRISSTADSIESKVSVLDNLVCDWGSTPPVSVDALPVTAKDLIIQSNNTVRPKDEVLTLGDYCLFIGCTEAEFWQRALANRYGAWDPTYTADYVNRFIRSNVRSTS